MIICEYIGGPLDGLLRLIPLYYRYSFASERDEVRAYWCNDHYVSPGIRLEA